MEWITSSRRIRAISIFATVGLVATMLMLVTVTGSATAATFYTVTDLGLPPGVHAGQIRDINSAGEIVGTYFDPSIPQSGGFLWSPTDGIVDIGANVEPRDINESGEVTGTVQGNNSRAFVWSQPSGITLLGTFGGCCSGGTAINSSGEVAGTSNTAVPQTHGFFWSQSTGMLDVGNTFGGNTTTAEDVNDAGHVVGRAHDGSFVHAYVWDQTNGMVPLTPELGISSIGIKVNEADEVSGNFGRSPSGQPGGFYWSSATGMVDVQPLSAETTVTNMNEVGQVVGQYCDTALSPGECQSDTPEFYAYVWNLADGFTDLGNLGRTRALPRAINNDGVVAGVVSADDSNPSTAFVWDSADGTRALPGLSPDQATQAWAINDAGVIAGTAVDGGITHAVMWSPGPAPPDPDTDHDGIYDEVDTNAVTPSTLFLETSTDPDTDGEILDTKGHAVTVEADPTGGVRIVVVGTGNQKARFRICGFLVQLLPGSDVSFSCASLIVEATAGDVEVLLDDAGVNFVVVPGGGSAEITQVAPDTYSVENLGSTEVTVTIDGEEATVPAGDVQEVTTWDFQGFTSPVDNPPVLNVVNSGQSVPLKWRLVRTDGTPITDLTSVTLRATTLSCADGTTNDLLEEVATGSSGLKNLGNGYYQFNWKTPKSYARSCKTLHLDVGQGVERQALFRFPK